MNKVFLKKLLFWCGLLGFIGFALGQKGTVDSNLMVWTGGGVILGSILAVIFFLLEKRKAKKSLNKY
ncbi:hypothetical protein [Microbulbifer sp. 2205BS26-8]|uniref:hypothetical protein n=1 Tax=Microbulbifer sp. 2205BS26-8 TaxID=3064386 RepID=UPI00273E82F2|nr:hypothetical protein [Microbulbifer sp. 2205BS26-8]MDP5211235.1 hypothetical protein [Microbulbifer sp. 2205BS26-8]